MLTQLIWGHFDDEDEDEDDDDGGGGEVGDGCYYYFGAVGGLEGGRSVHWEAKKVRAMNCLCSPFPDHFRRPANAIPIPFKSGSITSAPNINHLQTTDYLIQGMPNKLQRP